MRRSGTASNQYRAVAWFVVLSAALAVCAVVAAPAVRAGAAPAKQWTVMLYLDGENTDMQSDILIEFQNMIAAGVGSDAAVDVVAQFDRIPGSDRFGGWTEANRFHVTPGMEPTEANAIADWGDGRGGREVDMADPATLRDFVSWAAAEYPAERTALIIVDHGYGWKGLCIDETSLGATMSLKQLAAALQGLPRTIDLLGLDACLMQSAEVGYELRSCDLEVVVGSEASGTTWPLTQIIAAAQAEPGMATQTLAERTCDLYFAAHPGEEDITLSAYRLDGMVPLATAVSALADALGVPPHDQVQQRAQDVIDALGAAVFYSRTGSTYADAGGMSIYFPDFTGPHHQSMPTDYVYFYQSWVTSFSKDAGWHGLLWRYYNYAEGLDPRIYRARSGVLMIDDEPPQIPDAADLYDLCRRIISVAPTTTAEGCDDAWHRTPVEVILTAVPAPDALPVGYTEYRLDGGDWSQGTSFTVSAPADHSADGIHTVEYRSADTAVPPNVEAELTGAVRIDTTAPTTVALSAAMVKRGRKVVLRYRVNDVLPSGQALSPQAQITIAVKTRAGKTVKRLFPGLRATNAARSWTWRCGLRKGRYRYHVYATDLAGNTQSRVGS
ncbi:MAG TPA: clostripain-related cysteine peptidase, partial [Thermoleophilia bacterium]|nr:clostripain-related cysteine peptidase [Thermoleophilia bacterium]